MNRINWEAVGIHAALALIFTALPAAIGAVLWGTSAWVVAALFSAPLTAAGFVLREVITAADRHTVTLALGWRIVLDGEAGWSPWNLRLQAFAPAAVALLATLALGAAP